MQPQILFLCTGNYYRSRFAELYFNWLAEHAGLPHRAVSRGLGLTARNVGPISKNTRRELARLGVELDEADRYPLAASEADFEAATRIIAVDEDEHTPMIEDQYARWVERVEYWSVQDVEYIPPSEALPVLQQQVEALVAELAG